MKRKTQELEKFKFVLDSKIKDLKKDITPRELEIKKLGRETNLMDKELKEYNKINANLGFLVDDLRNRQVKMLSMSQTSRILIRQNANKIQQFKNHVYEVV